MRATGGIRQVRASAVTGNVLILYDSDRVRLARVIADLGRHATSPVRDDQPVTVDEGPHWHRVTTSVVVAELGADVLGLSSAEAAHRLERFGPNDLPVPQPKSSMAILADHLTSMPVLLLGGAAVLSLATGAMIDAVVILAVVAANAAVGYVTESRVERILTSLQAGGALHTIVRRDGEDIDVPAAALVPGDTLVLSAGREVPADARVLTSEGLAVDESALTGESLPRTKLAERLAGERPLADRVNMVYAGTVVVEGSGLAIVTATGRATEIGRVRELVAETTTPPTPLERELDHMGRRLVGVSLAFCGVTLLLGLARGVPGLEMIRSVVSLAVAAVPEGLPAVATTTLALGMQRMMRRRMLVRRLAAVESLGAVTIICADKTGTLTENRMTVDSWYVADRVYRQSAIAAAGATTDDCLARALVSCVLCNEAEVNGDDASSQGSSTELALLAAAATAGVVAADLRERWQLVAIRRRLDGDQWMATIHSDGQAKTQTASVKGAPEQVLARANRWFDGARAHPLRDDDRRRILAANAAIAAQGMRVLGIATAEVAPDGAPTFDDLLWLGLVGLRDPIRAGVREAITACRLAGIRTVILTGDQAATATAIGRELGLVSHGQPRVVEASELSGLGDDALAKLVRDVDVFARVTPAHKYQIVRSLRANGDVVAMTGDGVNDAAALRAADIGVAMGARGTDLARDVADVVLLDDDFASIVPAIAQGRTMHGNISKAVRFLLATNFSEILVTLAALAVGGTRPISAIQFLWINLLSDVAPALALAVEGPERDVMSRPPRDPRESILSGRVLTTTAADATLLTASALGLYALGLARYGPGAHAASLAFSGLTTAQLAHAIAYRAPASTGERARSPLVPVVAGTLGLQAAAMALPQLRGWLGLAPLSLADWMLVGVGAAAPLAVREIGRTFVSNSTHKGDAHGNQAQGFTAEAGQLQRSTNGGPPDRLRTRSTGRPQRHQQRRGALRRRAEPRA